MLFLHNLPAPSVPLDENHMRLWKIYAPYGQAPLTNADEFPWPLQDKRCTSPLGQVLAYINLLGEHMGEPYWSSESLKWATRTGKRIASELEDKPYSNQLWDVITFIFYAKDVAEIQEHATYVVEEAGGKYSPGANWTRESLSKMLCTILDVCATEHPHEWDDDQENARVNALRKRKREEAEAKAADAEEKAKHYMKLAREYRKAAKKT